jgi:hypothetical protein
MIHPSCSQPAGVILVFAKVMPSATQRPLCGKIGKALHAFFGSAIRDRSSYKATPGINAAFSVVSQFGRRGNLHCDAVAIVVAQSSALPR